MMRLRALSPGDWRLWRELRLQALAEAPYAFGSKLSDWQGAGDTPERWRARLVNVPLNVIAYLDNDAAGMIGATAANENGEVELISLWVAPIARGRGVGDALVECVIAWARDHAARFVVLAVAQGNRAAIQLYERHGFMDGGINPTQPGEMPERRMHRAL